MKVLEMRANKVTRRTIRQSSKSLLPTNYHQRTNLPTAKRFSHNPETETQDQTPRTAVHPVKKLPARTLPVKNPPIRASQAPQATSREIDRGRHPETSLNHRAANPAASETRATRHSRPRGMRNRIQGTNPKREIPPNLNLRIPRQTRTVIAIRGMPTNPINRQSPNAIHRNQRVSPWNGIWGRRFDG